MLTFPVDFFDKIKLGFQLLLNFDGLNQKLSNVLGK